MVFELDFARYYTVTLLSENLYVLTVTLTITPFVRWVRDGDRADLLRMAFLGRRIDADASAYAAVLFRRCC